MKRAHTIKDIAREAEVSTATVSRFLNKSGYVDNMTAQKIQRVIDKYDYIPSRTAQSLETKKTRQLMLIVPDISNPFYSETAKTIQALARERSYAVILYNTNEDTSEEVSSIKVSQEIGVDGIILYSIHVRTEVIDALNKVHLPAVVANSYENCPFDFVHGVLGEGTYLATKHLIGLGHGRIAFAGGSKESKTAARRRFGFVKAMEEAGLAYNDDYCFEMGFSEDAGYKAGKYFSSLSPMPTAVCCANDLIALGVLAAFNESGIKVPEEVSVTGMDNISYTTISRPRLTTVVNDSVEFGKQVTQLLFERIDGIYTGPAREVIIPRRLVVRDSTGKPREG